MIILPKNTKRRHHFGIVFPSLDNTHKYALMDGIAHFAEQNDIHLTAYFGSYQADNYDFASHYEPCFEAINNSTTLDGVAIFSGFIAHNIGTDVFRNYVNSIPKRIPVVSIGVAIPGVYTVLVDNAKGQYNAVEHLIKVHGKKEIAIIKGPDGHPEAEQRLLGYKQALADNNIEIRENLLLPGSFTPMSGREATTKLLDNRKITFDAIACCDDEAAIGAMKILKQRGMLVPEDIAVTGFDDVEEAAAQDPPLSTVQQDFSVLGTKAGELLLSLAQGNKIDDDTYIVPDFIIRKSCGCDSDTGHASKRITEAREDILRRRRITDNLVLQFDIENLTNELHKSMPVISIDTTMVGLYNHPIDGDAVDGDRTIDRVFGFDGQQKYNARNNSENPHLFSDYHLIDNFDFERERRTLFFLPLFFADEENGIALISYNGTNPVDAYETFRRNISTAVKGASLLDKIQLLSVTDELTGLLNRRGFFQYAYARILYLQRQREQGLIPVVLAMDMDGLKSVNDTYGHAEGDKAISTFAKLLKEILREEDIIGRLGGDEFAVLSVIKSEDNIEKLETRIREKFDGYNAQGHHPYKITGSIGAVVLEHPTNDCFDHAMLVADDVLYVEKSKKRKKGLSRQ